jgi:hypothetical protein
MNNPERGRECGVHQADWASVRNLAAYQAASRREFFQEVAAVVGGGVLILDTDLKTICGHEIIVQPTQH